MKIYLLWINILISTLLITGCGGSGGGGGNDSAPAMSPSFSPIKGVASDGSNVPLYWKYSVNNGDNISITQSGLLMNFKMNEVSINIDANGTLRTIIVNGKLSGNDEGESFSGSFNLLDKETLVDNTNTTLVSSSETKMTLALSGGGESLNMVVNAVTNFDTPYEWFLDNQELNSLGIGYIDNNSSTAIVSGSIDITGFGSESFSEQVIEDDTWEVTDYKSSVTVNGIIYNNIVVIERETQIPDISDNYVRMDTRTITYWVAKGIGMVKGIGYLNILGQSLDIELVETNLVQE